MNSYVTIVNKPKIFDETNMIITELKNGASDAMNVNGSVTPVVFSYSPPEGYNFECTRVVFFMEGATAFSSEKFGDLPVLTNGWELSVNGTVIMNVKDNSHLVTKLDEAKGLPVLGKETRTMLGRLDFAVLTDNRAGLMCKNGNAIAVNVNDNLSGLSVLTVSVEGHLTSKDELLYSI